MISKSVTRKLFALERHNKTYRDTFGGGFETNFVASVGNVNAAITIVGEAPSKVENKMRTPFLGMPGALLNTCLDAAGLTRQGAYVTNVLKYQPPENIFPRTGLINSLATMLRFEIRIVNSSIVLLLGPNATHVYFPNMHIGTIEGKVYEKNDEGVKRLVIPARHPEYIIRRPERGEEYFASMRKCLQDALAGRITGDPHWSADHDGRGL